MLILVSANPRVSSAQVDTPVVADEVAETSLISNLLGVPPVRMAPLLSLSKTVKIPSIGLCYAGKLPSFGLSYAGSSWDCTKSQMYRVFLDAFVIRLRSLSSLRSLSTYF